MSAHDTALVSTRSAAGRRELALLLAVAAVFILSGASGLVYQVVWVRMLSLVFGVTAYAISTVLSSFFAGLALGSFLSGRFADRLRSPLRAYAAIEALVAVTALLTPAAFALAQRAYLGAANGVGQDSLAALTAVRAVLAFAVLLVPTTLMGATLPLIVRATLARSESFGRNLSLLYAANTFGAMAGTFLAGFELIGRYGLRMTLLIAAGANVTAAIAALALTTAPRPADRLGRRRRATTPAPGEDDPPWGVRPARTALVVFGLSGAVSIAYEVVWARVLAMFFDASTYGFTAMLTMVLLGIGVGSWVVAPVITRRWPWPLVFAGIEAVVGALGLLALPLLTHVIPLGARLGLYEDPGPLGQFSVRFMAFAAFVIVFPPMLLLGASFPVAARVVGTGGGVGRRVGGVYAVNVFGGIVGSLICGFVLLPALGVRATLLALACANLLLALALVWSVAGAGARTALTGLGLVAVAVAGIVSAPNVLADIFRDRFAGQTVLWVDEGLENTVTVADNDLTGERKLYINGQPQATTWEVIANYHRLMGHLPMLLHPTRAGRW
ncbi:MAG: fused MFS/spermidine synthase [Dehalococcoidia bacterium]